MNNTNPKVDGYLRKATQWRNELQKLREILLDCGLTEDVKWRVPCYTVNDGNVALLGGFKEYCVLSFPKGALFKDPKGILRKPGENTRAGRIVRFTSVREIEKIEPAVRACIREAIEVERSGRSFDFKQDAALPVPDELQEKLDEMPALKTAFNALTPGRQRAYILYFSAARQPKPRATRVATCVPQILKGKGLDDDYRAKRK